MLLGGLAGTFPNIKRMWADTAYRSKANEKYLADNGLRSQIHRKKPPGRPMPLNVARANGAKSKVRSAVEHVFAHQKGPMGLVVRTIGLARATVKIGLANIVYNMRRAVWLTQRRMADRDDFPNAHGFCIGILIPRSAATAIADS